MKHGSCTALRSKVYLEEALYTYNGFTERSNGHALLRATAKAEAGGGAVSLRELQQVRCRKQPSVSAPHLVSCMHGSSINGCE